MGTMMGFVLIVSAFAIFGIGAVGYHDLIVNGYSDNTALIIPAIALIGGGFTVALGLFELEKGLCRGEENG